MTARASARSPARPSPQEVSADLGRAAPAWDHLLNTLRDRYAPLTETWQYGGERSWTLRLIQRNRTVVYLTPGHGRFRAGFALGERAVGALRGAVPPAVMAEIDGARRYAEGRAVRLEVRTRADAMLVESIAAAKMAFR